MKTVILELKMTFVQKSVFGLMGISAKVGNHAVWVPSSPEKLYILVVCSFRRKS